MTLKRLRFGQTFSDTPSPGAQRIMRQHEVSVPDHQSTRYQEIAAIQRNGCYRVETLARRNAEVYKQLGLPRQAQRYTNVADVLRLYALT